MVARESVGRSVVAAKDVLYDEAIATKITRKDFAAKDKLTLLIIEWLPESSQSFAFARVGIPVIQDWYWADGFRPRLVP